jgi:hypothetical protein
VQKRSWFAALAFLFASKASAHGGFPATVSLLGLSADRASLVRLTHGLAYRSDEGFRFLCPEAWGGDVSAPIAAIPGGPIVIAGEQLYLLAPTGELTRHPSDVGQASALSANAEALFGLFRRDGHDELRRITETTSELVASLDQRFSALSARDGELALLRFFNNVLVVQRLSPSGALREPESWSMPSQVSSAELRRDGEQLYVVVGGSAEPWFTLGRLGASGFQPLSEAQSSFAGPLSFAGSTLLARDGTLALLADGAAWSESADAVSCLDSLLGQPFACVRDGLVRVAEDGLGEPLFTFAELRAPDYEALPEPQRADCKSRFSDLSQHLASADLWQEPGDAGANDDVDGGSAAALARPNAAGCALRSGPLSGAWSSCLLALGLLVSRVRRGRAGVGRVRSRCAAEAPSSV